MAAGVDIGAVNNFPEGQMTSVIVQGKKIAVTCIEGEYFAVDDTCSHDNCSFSGDGFLDQTTLICGCHGAQFDVTTGKVLSLPATRDVRSYAVTIVNGRLFISV